MFSGTSKGDGMIAHAYFRVKQSVPLRLNEVDDALEGSRKCGPSHEQSEEHQVGEEGREISDLGRFRGFS